jgi:hypothetical protein
MNDSVKHATVRQETLPLLEKKGRRKFVQGVGVALPVVLSVRSTSALAGGQCFAPSAHASIALLHSRPDREKLYCRGRTPGFWVNAARRDHPNHSDWVSIFGPDPASPPAPSNAITSPLFESIFAGGFPGKRFHEVMALNGVGDPFQFGAHLAAAYCNNLRGWVPSDVLSLSDLQEMWAGRNGTYHPTAGVSWGAQAITAYLQTTMTE